MDESTPIFAPDGLLTPLEKEFIRCTEAGDGFVPPKQGGQIRGALIRAILMGRSLRKHADKESNPDGVVRLTRRGIRILARPGCEASPLTITGPLALAALTAPNGGFLPGLEFENCTFDHALELSGIHVQALALRACRFSALYARGAKIDGDVAILRCRPRLDPSDEGETRFAQRQLVAWKSGLTRLEPGATRAPPSASEACGCPLCAKAADADERRCGLCCVVNLSASAISGGLKISHCYLRAANLIGREYRTPTIRDGDAIALAGIQVRDSIHIVRCSVIGRTSLVSAEIGDDVWVSGGRYCASSEREAFDFQLATIAGMLAFQAHLALPEEEAKDVRAYPVAVVGQISGVDLDAGEVWLGEGFYYAQDPGRRGSYPTIDFAKADLKRSFKVGLYHPHEADDPTRPTGEARVQGEIHLAAANIGKNLEMHGVGFEGIGDALDLGDDFYRYFGVYRSEEYLKVRAHGLNVDRRVNISHAHFADATPGVRSTQGEAPSSDAPPPPPRESVAAAIDLWKSTIGTGFRFSEDCTSVGAIRLNNCVIGREVVIAGGRISPSAADFAAVGMIASDIPVSLDISESTITGRVRIGRRVPKAHSPEFGSPGTAITVCGGISLESTDVRGSLVLAHLFVDLTGFELGADSGWASEQPGEPSRPPQRVALNLRDCRCGSEFEVHALRWQLPSLSSREASLLSNEHRLLDRLVPTRHKCRYFCIDGSSHALIDLRGFQCGLLVDGLGTGWGLIYRLQLKLAGTRIGDVEPPAEKPVHSDGHGADPSRRRWLGFQHRLQEIEDKSQIAKEQGLLSAVWDRFWARFYCCTEDDFIPQAYDVFSAAYRRAGEDRAAEAILIERKNVQNALRFRRLRELWYSGGEFPKWAWWLGLIPLAILLWNASWQSGFVANAPQDRFAGALGFAAAAFALAFWPWLVALFQIIFRAGFRYGLSPDRALLVFVICILVGWMGVHLARNGGLATVTDWTTKTHDGKLDEDVALVLQVDRQPALAGGTRIEEGRYGRAEIRGAGTRIERPPVYAGPSPCNLDVSNLLYATDLFIPLIDLDQERRCAVRDALPEDQHDHYSEWRLARALYELLGWIITSLVILTVTGVLRRDLER